ncbi:phosphoribosylformylglycinamidine cyclo-ligase [Halobacteriovorax marinus]|uniref:Phosphoribosylformylglycinamidine cyclo-ligase n=1 Tax=Halobacteriovorax marinus TaxID=97084 RepID=A0A1Y5FED7_9BACT|nr:phosphoribosylformylglycinamidine cyclo-ligase [Halobacteriovorax marinus]
MSKTYKDVGVDITKGDAFVEKIKKKVKSTYGENVISGVGGFACLYKMDDERLLSAGTDGVGTKLLLAQKFNKHDTIGIDLVAMCVNDILCTGAKPLFFMDYLACSSLDVEVSSSIVDGVVEGCLQSSCALIGGETAEMPGLYKSGEYDLAGFAVGEVYRDKLVDGSKIKSGQTILGLPSSGAHSNGYSLLREIYKNDDEMLQRLLTPTKIYTKEVTPLINDGLVSGIAHITGGGIHNISRLNKSLDYELNSWPDIHSASFMDAHTDLFSRISKDSKLSDEELYKTFNMGIGMAIMTDHPEEILSLIPGSMVLGVVKEGSGNTYMRTL